MNRKNVFQQICQHAMTMNQKAVLNDSCSYRSPSGPCLIGSLINDEHYNTEFENEGANHELVIEALKKSNVVINRHQDLDLLTEIQEAHDNIDTDDDGYSPNFKSELRHNLMYVAEKYNIPFPRFYKAIED